MRKLIGLAFVALPCHVLWVSLNFLFLISSLTTEGTKEIGKLSQVKK